MRRCIFRKTFNNVKQFLERVLQNLQYCMLRSTFSGFKIL